MNAPFAALRRIGCLIVTLVVIGPFAPQPAAADDSAPMESTVSTFAGSGRAGTADGRSGNAEFLSPVALAEDRSGVVYVADDEAQRIRAIDPSGYVRTVAGGGETDSSGLHVAGSFRNGAASIARFDLPSGIAVRSDGALLIADRGNHCIRLVKDGVVSTFVGDPGGRGGVDGSREVARFNEPIGIAIDARDDLYVADFGNGLRKIDPAGNVTSVALPKGRGLAITQVSVDSASTPRLYVTLETGLARIDIATGATVFFATGGQNLPDQDPLPHVYVPGQHSIGHPFAVAPLADVGFVYTDPWSQSLRISFDTTVRTIAGPDGENAAFTGGMYRDGTGNSARFASPTGLLRMPDGRLLIADTNNRRVRVCSIPMFRKTAWLEAMSRAPDRYRIAYVGNSVIAYNTSPERTIGVALEKGLNAGHASLPRPASVFSFPIIGSVTGIGQFISEDLATGTADLVVWQLNATEIASLQEIAGGNPRGVYLSADPNTWRPPFDAALRSVVAACREARIPLIIAINPLAPQLSPGESWYGKMYLDDHHSFEHYEADTSLILAETRKMGIPTIDLTPAFERVERQADHPSLFASINYHYSEAGSELVANELLAALLREHPWRSKSSLPESKDR